MQIQNNQPKYTSFGALSYKSPNYRQLAQAITIEQEFANEVVSAITKVEQLSSIKAKSFIDSSFKLIASARGLKVFRHVKDDGTTIIKSTKNDIPFKEIIKYPVKNESTQFYPRNIFDAQAHTARWPRKIISVNNYQKDLHSEIIIDKNRKIQTNSVVSAIDNIVLSANNRIKKINNTELIINEDGLYTLIARMNRRLSNSASDIIENIKRQLIILDGKKNLVNQLNTTSTINPHFKPSEVVIYDIFDYARKYDYNVQKIYSKLF